MRKNAISFLSTWFTELKATSACEYHLNLNLSFQVLDKITISSLKWLQARFAKNLNLQSSYFKFMQEYLNLGHMEELTQDEVDRPKVYYTPHHPVVNKGKLRVVFNASAPAFNQLSLNKTLHTGQKLQQNIVNVITRWRCFRIVFTCDIVKMFRQILIGPRDRDWLRIVLDFGAGIQHF